MASQLCGRNELENIILFLLFDIVAIQRIHILSHNRVIVILEWSHIAVFKEFNREYGQNPPFRSRLAILGQPPRALPLNLIRLNLVLF